jgi:hypothetical protein
MERTEGGGNNNTKVSGTYTIEWMQHNVRRAGVEWRARVVERGCGLTEQDAQRKRHMHIHSVTKGNGVGHGADAPRQ